MSLTVIWSDEAKAEFYDAEQWYADIGIPLSERFVQAVENTVQLIAESPFGFLLFIKAADAPQCGAFLMAYFTKLKPSEFCSLPASTESAIHAVGSAARISLS